jgi:hypothetical protein
MKWTAPISLGEEVKKEVSNVDRVTDQENSQNPYANVHNFPTLMVVSAI